MSSEFGPVPVLVGETTEVSLVCEKLDADVKDKLIEVAKDGVGADEEATTKVDGGGVVAPSVSVRAGSSISDLSVEGSGSEGACEVDLPFSSFTGGRRDAALLLLCSLSGAGLTGLGGIVGSASISGACEEGGIASLSGAGTFIDDGGCWFSAGFCGLGC